MARQPRLPAFIPVAKAIGKLREGILAAIELGISTARSESLNNHVRLITPRQGPGLRMRSLALVALS